MNLFASSFSEFIYECLLMGSVSSKEASSEFLVVVVCCCGDNDNCTLSEKPALASNQLGSSCGGA